MRIAEVIGTVTLSRSHPSLAGARFVIGVPFSLAALRDRGGPDGEELVILDELGAGAGHRIGRAGGPPAGDTLWRWISNHLNLRSPTRPGRGSSTSVGSGSAT